MEGGGREGEGERGRERERWRVAVEWGRGIGASDGGVSVNFFKPQEEKRRARERPTAV